MAREYLPIEPIVLAIQRRGIQVGRGELARAFYRARRAGRVTVAAADELCVRLLDSHPIEIFGLDVWCADELAHA